MSILTEVLTDELNRLERHKTVLQEDLSSLPKGYISKKNIRGNISYYLQYREGEKIVSKYIPRALLRDIENQIERRKQLQEKLRYIQAEQNRIRRVLG